MSSADAIIKLQKLSAEHANQVFALIDDLAELETLENAQDLKEARESLAELEANPGTVSYEQLRREAGLRR